VNRTEQVSIRLTLHEKEWLRRRAYWEGVPAAALLRSLLRSEMAEGGYLRPPDDEPQDFGFEKEMMEAART
jgi:hypothetical protein